MLLKVRKSGFGECDGSIPLIDFAIINIPVWLFLCLAVLSGACIPLFLFPIKIIPLAVVWWSICGAVMLFIDFYKRKRGLYLRLRSHFPVGRTTPLEGSLKETLCGFAVYAAARRYSCAIRA